MNAVVFYLGNNESGYNKNFMDKEILKKSEKEYPNIEFASHSYDLHWKGEKTPDIIQKDIQKMNNIVKSKFYAFPYGIYNDQYIQILKDNGFEMAFGFGPGKEHRKANINDDNFKIPRLNITNEMSDLKFILRMILPI